MTVAFLCLESCPHVFEEAIACRASPQHAGCACPRPWGWGALAPTRAFPHRQLWVKKKQSSLPPVSVPTVIQPRPPTTCKILRVTQHCTLTPRSGLPLPEGSWHSGAPKHSGSLRSLQLF